MLFIIENAVGREIQGLAVLLSLLRLLSARPGCQSFLKEFEHIDLSASFDCI